MRRGAASMWLLLLVLPMVGMLVGFMAGAVGSYVAPREFESIAVVQVMPMAGGEVILGEVAMTRVTPEQFFATEREVIHSRKTMEGVVNALDLVRRWSLAEEECVAFLKEIVTVDQVRGTDLIEIRVRHASAQDAQDVAGEVMTQYRDRRTQLEVDRSKKLLAALDLELREQEGVVEEKRKVLDTIVQAVGIALFDPDEGDALEREVARIYETAVQSLDELDRERESLAIQVRQLTELSNEELLGYAAGLQLPQNGVTTRYEEYRAEMVKLNDLLDGGLADAHPKVLAQRVRVDVLRKDLDRAVKILRDVMETQLELVDTRLEKMRRVLSKRREEASDRGVGEEDYLRAKRDYEEAVSLLRHQKLAQSGRRIAATVPRHPITVHEIPRVGKNPVTPKVSLFLGGGALVGAALGVGLAILIGLVGKLTKREG